MIKTYRRTCDLASDVFDILEKEGFMDGSISRVVVNPQNFTIINPRTINTDCSVGEDYRFEADAEIEVRKIIK